MGIRESRVIVGRYVLTAEDIIACRCFGDAIAVAGYPVDIHHAKANLMMDCMRKYLPEGVTFTPTEGGMFLWATLPDSITSVDLYRAALAKGVAICPGDPFYEIDRGVHTVRLNYSNSTDEIIEKGMKLLGEACAELLGK